MPLKSFSLLPLQNWQSFQELPWHYIFKFERPLLAYLLKLPYCKLYSDIFSEWHYIKPPCYVLVCINALLEINQKVLFYACCWAFRLMDIKRKLKVDDYRFLLSFFFKILYRVPLDKNICTFQMPPESINEIGGAYS